MPIYAFECTHCGHQFERLQRLADADPTQCPECHAEQIRRQLTAPSFRLAGAGWYETDFKKDGDKQRNLVDKKQPTTESQQASAGKDKPESGTESKAEATPKAADPAKGNSGSPDKINPSASNSVKSEPAAAAKPKVEKPASSD